MRADWRWLFTFAGNVLFLFIVSQINHHLTYAPLIGLRGPVYLFVLGLPVAFAALRLSLKQGLVAVALTGLAAEAGTPLPPGTLLLAASAAFCITVAVRGNFNRFEPTSSIFVALLINLALFATVTAIARPVPGTATFIRLAVDLLVSQAVVATLTGWFFAYQVAILQLFGINLETELRQPT